MKRKYIYLLMIITTLFLTSCKKTKKITINSCKNCAFAFYNEESSKEFGKNVYLKDFTYDYHELKNQNGETRKMFLGHILNNGKIKRGFACGINNGNVFCIEGTYDGSKYEDNVQILKNVFGDINCKEDDYFISCKDDIFAGTNRDGTANVGVSASDIECNAISNGTMNCS
ncbi:MAG: hypothetical protein IKN87_00610 [Bacilli bacterium]|nr:hypothetical protein [Bacilli bacterium]